jgi:hypothetical protein
VRERQHEISGSSIHKLLERKGLATTMFDPPHSICLQDDISAHAKWVNDSIYQHPYPEDQYKAIARSLHGIQHVSRVAIYVSVFANLYRKHADIAAQQLTDNDLKLLQIAALFHDSAREKEGKDEWDHESGMLLYIYLTKVLNVARDKAKSIAEAVVNKDQPSPYLAIIENEEHEVFCSPVTGDQPTPKNIYQKIIHDSDCLDIIRIREKYDATYLDFYHDFCTPPSENIFGLDELAQLITEARSLIAHQGNDYQEQKLESRVNECFRVKKGYQQQCYEQTQHDLETHQLSILSKLGGGLCDLEQLQHDPLIDCTHYDSRKSLTESNNINAALREGKVLLRGIQTPSKPAQKNQEETSVQLETRKVFREPGIPTRTNKENRFMKHGNPLRSFSMIGHGACALWSRAGFMLIDPNVSSIIHVADHNIRSGKGKKIGSIEYRKKRGNDDELQQALAGVNRFLKLGGSTENHAEILCDVMHYDAIYFTTDPHNIENKCLKSHHQLFGLLDARILRKEYARTYTETQNLFIQTLGEEEGTRRFRQRFGDAKMLPVFYYSGTHNKLQQVTEEALSDENIFTIWTDLCRQSLEKTIKNGDNIDELSIDKIMLDGLNLMRVANRITEQDMRAMIDSSSNSSLFNTRLTSHLQEIQRELVASAKYVISIHIPVNLRHEIIPLFSAISARLALEEHFCKSKNNISIVFNGAGDTPHGMQSAKEKCSEYAFSDDIIVTMWADLCQKYMQEKLNNKERIDELSVEDIMFQAAMSKNCDLKRLIKGKKILSDQLNKILEEQIEEARQQILGSTIIPSFSLDRTLSSFRQAQNFNILCKFPSIFINFQREILLTLTNFSQQMPDSTQSDASFILFENFAYTNMSDVEFKELHSGITLERFVDLAKQYKFLAGPLLQACLICQTLSTTEKGLSKIDHDRFCKLKETIQNQAQLFILTKAREIDQMIEYYVPVESELAENTSSIVLKALLDLKLCVQFFPSKKDSEQEERLSQRILDFLNRLAEPDCVGSYARVVQCLIATHTLDDVHKKSIYKVYTQNLQGTANPSLSMASMINLSRSLPIETRKNHIVFWLQTHPNFQLSAQDLQDIVRIIASEPVDDIQVLDYFLINIDTKQELTASLQSIFQNQLEKLVNTNETSLMDRSRMKVLRHLNDLLPASKTSANYNDKLPPLLDQIEEDKFCILSTTKLKKSICRVSEDDSLNNLPTYRPR